MPQQLNVADLKISSPAFDGHGAIPAKHTGDDHVIEQARVVGTYEH